MGRFANYLILWSVVVAVTVTTLGCGPKSPEEKIAELRSFYTARVGGLIVEEEPIFAEVAVADSLEGEEAVQEVAAGAEAEMAVEEEPVAVRQTARLDILIQHRAPERLPGITVDIAQLDAAKNEKQHWRVWLDTTDVERATVTQFTHILEDVSYEESDGFTGEIRYPVPVEERGEYREFAPAP